MTADIPEIPVATRVTAAPHVPYFLPGQPAPAGKPVPTGKPLPRLFQGLKIKNLDIHNRIWVSPMCMYSADNGFATPFHFQHYSALASRGPGLITVESTAVAPEGRITANCLGIWTDEHAKKLREIVDYAHAVDQVIGIQLGHAGRKGSTEPPYISLLKSVSDAHGGWNDKLAAPSPLPFLAGVTATPHELSEAEIAAVVEQFAEAARRAVEIAKFDFVEIHGAHGYLLNSFFSAATNKRTDKYGGSFENRTRILFEIIEAVKAKIGTKVPIFVRLSAVDGKDSDPDSWKLEDTVKLADLLADSGISVLDISSRGNLADGDHGSHDYSEHFRFAKAVKQKVGNRMLVTSVRNIQKAEDAETIVEAGIDAVFVGKFFLRNPGLVWTWADDLGVRLHEIQQYEWGFYPKIGK